MQRAQRSSSSCLGVFGAVAATCSLIFLVSLDSVMTEESADLPSEMVYWYLLPTALILRPFMITKLAFYVDSLGLQIMLS